MRITCKLMLATVVAFLFAAQLPAQDATEMLNRMKAMEERIKALETEVQTLKGQQTSAVAPRPAAPVAAPVPEPVAAPVPAPVAQAAPPDMTALGGAAGAAAKVLNPDISVIGDFIGAAGNHGGRATPALEMHESEVGFQEVIDPYARADFFLSFGEKGVNLEEGYLTFTSLPAGLQVKVGKMRAAFGRVNTTHNHVLPWIDRPLVSQNLVGGEDGIDDAGLSISRILPSPKGLFLEGTAQVFRGDSDNVFAADRRSHIAGVGHLRAYSDLSESTNVELGASYARGHSPFADGNNQLYGADVTLHWKPLRRAIYHSFIARSELVWTRTSVSPQFLGLGAITGTFCTSAPCINFSPPITPQRALAKPFGFFVSGDYQVNRRWIVAGRFDRSERGQCLPTNPSTDNCVIPVTLGAMPLPVTPVFANFSRNIPLLQDTGGSFLVTYIASEFSLIRTQFRRAKYGEGRTANEILFQFQFSMGAHGAHPF